MCLVAKVLRPIAQRVDRIEKVSLEPIVAKSVAAGVHFEAKAGAGEEGILEPLNMQRKHRARQDPTTEPPQSCWSMAEAGTLVAPSGSRH